MKRNIKAKLVVLIGIMVVMIAAVTGCGSSKKVSLNLSDYVSISFSGMDGEGTASVGFDYSQMELDYAGVTDNNPTSDQLQQMVELYSFENTISYSVENDGALSNGDEVTITISYGSDEADALNIEVSGATCTATVDGLNTVTYVDPFDETVFNTDSGFSYYFTGYSPLVYCQTSNNSSGEPYGYISYNIDSNGPYAMGDEITVTASMSSSGEAAGYELTQTETTITVDSCDGYYITDMSQLTDDQIKTINEQLTVAWNNNSYPTLYFTSNESHDVIYNYFTAPTEFTFNYLGSNGMAPEMIFTYTASYDSGPDNDITSEIYYQGQIYGFITYADVRIESDGSLDLRNAYIGSSKNFVSEDDMWLYLDTTYTTYE